MLNFKDTSNSDCIVQVLAVLFSVELFFYHFDFLSSGKYELIPHYKGENTVFDVSPPVMPVSVEHQHVTVPKKFQVR